MPPTIWAGSGHFLSASPARPASTTPSKASSSEALLSVRAISTGTEAQALSRLVPVRCVPVGGSLVVVTDDSPRS